MDLIHLIFSVEEGVPRNHFEENTAVTPNIHFVIVIAISHEALGSPVPTSGDVLGVRVLTVDSLT
jgi:hypothetical protein